MYTLCFFYFDVLFYVSFQCEDFLCHPLVCPEAHDISHVDVGCNSHHQVLYCLMFLGAQWAACHYDAVKLLPYFADHITRVHKDGDEIAGRCRFFFIHVI